MLTISIILNVVLVVAVIFCDIRNIKLKSDYIDLASRHDKLWKSINEATEHKDQFYKERGES